MTTLLEAWSNYRVNREYIISSTLIGAKLENNENKIDDPKVDSVEEDQAPILLKKKKNERDGASITSKQKITQLKN